MSFKVTHRRKIPNVYETGFGNSIWGNVIEFTDWKAGKVHGWLSIRPLVGDRLRIACQSGKTLIAEFREVEHCGDPGDMFFGMLKLIGYEGESSVPVYVRRIEP